MRARYVINFDTVLRAICTVAAVCALAGTAMAQSILNFTPKGPAGIAVTNTSPYIADVKFTLYDRAGAVVTGVNNNRSYRIPAGGQLAAMSSEIFPPKNGVQPEGWIQAISEVTGLQGFYFSGDFVNTFDGAEASSPAHEQTISYLPSSLGSHTTILVTNPGSQPVDVNLFFYDATGRLVPNGSLEATLSGHSQTTFSGMGASARVVTVNDDEAVLATAVAELPTALMLLQGQVALSQTSRWVVPYFKNGQGVTSTLALANPSSNPAAATVTFYGNDGVAAFQPSQTFPVPANGVTLVTWEGIAGIIPPVGDGWLLVQSAMPLTGAALVTNGWSLTAIPMQASGADRMLFSRAVTQGLTTRLTLVGDFGLDTSVELLLSRPDGTIAAQSTVPLRARTRISRLVSDLVPAVGFQGGFLIVRSTAPIFGVELMDLADGRSEAVVTPQRLSAAFSPGQNSGAPRIVKATLTDPDGMLRPGARLKLDTQNVQGDAVLWVGNQSVGVMPVGLNGASFTAVLPPVLEPGEVQIRVRSAGMDSNTETLGPYSPDGSLGPNSQVLRGHAFFQKVEVTDNGLDTNLTSLVPIRNARVDVIDTVTQAIVSVSETDELGDFEVLVPPLPGLILRVSSQLRWQDMKVLNNAANNSLYSISASIDGLQTNDIELIVTSRSAGAFNILDALQKGNALIMNTGLGAAPPPLTIYWSEKNDAAALAKLTNGAIRTTFFNPATNSAYILGDRNTDSDEFDDSVILHEYAHMLAAKFSRDDSPGGPHLLGDLLDPRIAWSEGWANFFSSAARGSSIWRDSKAQNTVLRFDIEDNVPVGDHPGYTSEASVDGLLWDLIDENADKDDTAQFPFASIWSAFTDLARDRNVYLPYFLEHFLQRNPAFAEGLRTMVVARSIDFQPDVRPSVTNPFPRTITVGGFQTGQVDSFTTKRTNLSNSSHFFSLSIPTTSPVLLRLAIEGLGPANNPGANDLDLFLYDSTGKKIIAQSDGAYNGGGEIISATLAPGTYFIEVRSFYNRNDNNTMVTVFNSGDYRLRVDKF